MLHQMPHHGTLLRQENRGQVTRKMFKRFLLIGWKSFRQPTGEEDTSAEGNSGLPQQDEEAMTATMMREEMMMLVYFLL